MPGAGLHAVFLSQGMTSSDTLGTGATGNVSSIVPSVTLNGTIPDDGNLIPRPWKSRATSVGAAIGTPNASPAVTNTYTLQQIADFLNKYIFGPAMGPQDELSPFDRRLQSSLATVGQPSQLPVRLLGARSQNPIGAGMDDWSANYVRGNAASSAAATNAVNGRAGRRVPAGDRHPPLHPARLRYLTYRRLRKMFPADFQA